MDFSIIRKSVLLKVVVIILSIFYLQSSYSTTTKELPVEDLRWYKDKMVNTHRALKDQAKEDIEKGIEDKENNSNITNNHDKKAKDSKKVIKKSGDAGNCINVTSIEFDGGYMIPGKLKNDINDEYLDKCLTTIDIESIMSTIVNGLINKGYSTTRVYLEAQDLTSGVLRMRIQEGIVSDIILEDDDNKSIYLPTLFPFIIGDVLNLTRIEQGISQANKQRSNQTTMDIIPGENAGDSIIVVKNKKSFPLHFNGSFDNHGSPSTGQIQGAATVTADNMIGLNDTLTFTHRQSIPDMNINHPGESMSDSLALMVPFGFFTHTFSYSKSKYRSYLKSPSGAELISSGSTDSFSGTIDRVMYRNADTIANSYLKVNFNSGNNYLNGTRLDISSTNTSSVTIGSSISGRVFENPFSVSIDYSIGAPLFGAIKNQNNISENYPFNSFKKLGFTASYTQPLSWILDDLTLTSSLAGQFAFNNLPSSQRISIGSKSSVRGYSDSSLSGDNGAYIRNDISLRNVIGSNPENIRVSVSAGYDYGWVKNRYDLGSGTDGELSGGSVGVTVLWKKVTATFSYDYAIHKPESTPRESGQFWWRLSMNI
ncbi:MAG: ShlB/FhaC/HecB family hemolysin secretion/activation protein [Candidatus Endonucleobacter sp. (ex Gigantidas childressi)]|nr:ShlB/FhaC/HecB family hemolysin secretion/activation protein [Candidatus Endonucleobacter sp. (ex Gigantidas childressi)]